MDQPMESQTPSLVGDLAGLGVGDQEAARRIYQRFVDQLVRLAARRLDRRLGAMVDPETVVQSVFQSFFQGQRAGEYELGSWAMVYGLLAHITARKCLNRNRNLRRAKRDASRNIALEDWLVMAKGPTPEDEAAAQEALETALAGFDAEQRAMIDAFLAGKSPKEVALAQGFSTRTAERVLERFRKQLLALLADE